MSVVGVGLRRGWFATPNTLKPPLTMIVVGIKDSGKKTHWYPGHPNDVSNDGAQEFTIKAIKGWDAYRLAELFWLRVNSTTAPVHPVKFNWEKEFWFDTCTI